MPPLNPFDLIKLISTIAPGVRSLYNSVTEASDRQIAIALVEFLSGKRVLTDPPYAEYPIGCYRAVEAIRERIGNDLERLPSVKLKESLKKMRSICMAFMAVTESLDLVESRDRMTDLTPRTQIAYISALDSFRSEVGVQIAVLGVECGIAIPAELVRFVHKGMFPELKIQSTEEH